MIYDLQKASMMKRFSAFLLDFILLIILTTGFMWLISAVTGYADYTSAIDNKMSEIEAKYDIPAISEEYKIDLNQYDILSKEEKEKYPAEVRAAFDACIEEINSNDDIKHTYVMIISLTILMVSLSLFLATFLLEFVVPLILKNGQTVGKKVFALAVMRIDGIRVTPVIMFVRSILGKYTVEIMIPVIILLMLFFGVGSIVTLAVIPLILIFELILVIATKTNSFIHDVLSSTVLVDLPSQMIFDSVEAKLEYQARIHSEDAKKAKY